jgi:hypothetical protein
MRPEFIRSVSQGDALTRSRGAAEFFHAGLFILFVLTLSGCGESYQGEEVRKGVTEVAPAAAAPGRASPAKPADNSPLGLVTRAEGSESTKPTAGAAEAVARKIIYDAQVDLVVESISTLTADLTR